MRRNRIVPDRERPLPRAGPHSLVFISKLEEHCIRILEGGYRRYCVLLSPAQLDRMLGDPKLKSVFISRPEGFRHCFYIPYIARKAEAILAGMADEYDRPGPFSRAYLAALFRQLMILCYREKQTQFSLPAKSFNPAVFEVRKYIDRNFTREFSVGEISARSGFGDVNGFIRSFKK